MKPIGLLRFVAMGGIVVLLCVVPNARADIGLAPPRALTEVELLDLSVARSDVIVLARVLTASSRLEHSALAGDGQYLYETTLTVRPLHVFKGAEYATNPMVIRGTEDAEALVHSNALSNNVAILFVRKAANPDSLRWPFVLNGNSSTIADGVLDPSTPRGHSISGRLSAIVQSQEPESLSARADLVVEGTASMAGPMLQDGVVRVPTVAIVRPVVIAGEVTGDTIYVERLLPSVIVDEVQSVLFLEHIQGNFFRPLGVSAGVIRLDGKQWGRHNLRGIDVRAIARSSWLKFHARGSVK
jgi:hypothetical protein